jgi:ribosomal-protein-alanine N-acetyltransferase
MTDAEIVLRRNRPSDFETLYRIDQLCYPPGIAYDRIVMAYYLGGPGAFCKVAEVDRAVAGFIITHRRRTVAHIITIDVLEAYRRMRIGTQLLLAAESDAKSQGVSRIDLETATTNKAAIALWKKHGYREIGTVKDYFGRGLDAYEMQKLLQDQANSKPPRR